MHLKPQSSQRKIYKKRKTFYSQDFSVFSNKTNRELTKLS
jgi:hypothetical protein